MRARARASVAAKPSLTPDERDRLYILLAPMREHLRQMAAEKAKRGTA